MGRLTRWRRAAALAAAALIAAAPLAPSAAQDRDAGAAGAQAGAGAPAAAPAPTPRGTVPPHAPAKRLFGAKSGPADGAAKIYGGYARGCIAGAIELAARGPGWQTMRPSRNRAYGHPDLVAFIERLSVKAKAHGWPGLLVGDLAQPRGGPMLTGHRSHQIGIDADIWLRPAPETPFTRKERETVSALSVVSRRDKRKLNRRWTPTHHRILRDAASDPAIARIFVNPAIKLRMCADAEAAGEDTGWLRRIRAWRGHDAHFHVRLNCPADSPGCTPQKAPPPGDGCDDLDYWFAPPKPAATPPPPRKKRREITLADLPAACAAVLSAR